jgi:dTMP kinase
VDERGRLIAIEGIDGSGKSTQARLLADALGALRTHEPGATPLGRSVRALVLETDGAPVSPRAEALLMAADRAQHVAEVVAPALDAGRWVVTDRYCGSTLAYQGYGQGLGLDDLERLVRWAAQGIDADLNVLVDVAPDVADARRSPTPDRLEKLDAGFHTRVREGYLALAAADPGHWTVVDGSGSVAEVADAVRAAVESRLGWPRKWRA